MIGYMLEKIELNSGMETENYLIIAKHQGPEIYPIHSMEKFSYNEVKITGLFSPDVITSLINNAHVTIMTLDLESRQNYQLKGRCLEIKNVVYADGILPVEERNHSSALEWELTISVDAVQDLGNIRGEFDFMFTKANNN